MAGGTNNPSVHYLGVYGVAARQNHAECAAQWERIKAERSDEYGPLGAYNFGGCVHGERFVGRGWDMDSAANGGENGVWYNQGSRALCILVGTDDLIPSACVNMIREFANEAVNEHGMEWPLKGHSEYVATSCPGDNLRLVIEDMNARHDTPAPTPAPPAPAPAPSHQEEAMRIVCGPRQGMIGQVAYLLDGDQLLVEWNGNDVEIFGVKMPKKASDFLAGTAGITYQQMLPGPDANVNDLRSKVMTQIRWPGGKERAVPPIEIHD